MPSLTGHRRPPLTLSPSVHPSTQASAVSDLLVFDKIKERLGGRVRVVVSGGAPLAPAIEEFLKIAMCAPVVQVCSVVRCGVDQL